MRFELLVLLVSTGLAEEMSLSHHGHKVVRQELHGRITLVEAGSSRMLAVGCIGAATYSWSADDRRLAVTLGGGVTVFEGAGRRLRQVARASRAELSPNGRWLAFVREHELWVATVDGLQERRIAGGANVLAGEPESTYAREFGATSHLWWSPDSATLAFIETEFADGHRDVRPGGKLPTFRLKVAEVASGRVRLVAQSGNDWAYLLRVSWHPDSRRVAYYRLNRLQDQAELRLEGRTILAERDRYWVNALETPVFRPDGRAVVVSSERSGNRHLYLYRLDGHLLRQLTPAGMEIYRLYPVSRAIYVQASEGNRQQQHLYRLAWTGGSARRLTVEEGWHEVALSADGEAFLDTYSTASKPTSTWWQRAGKRRELASPAQDVAVANEFMQIEMHDKVKLPARLFKPANFDAARKYPVILYTYSGPRGRVVKDEWGGWQMDWNREMVRKGFLVLAVDVRGSGGYGHWFEEYIHYRFGAQEVSDLREVVGYLQRQSYVDGARLGIWGSEYGGHIALHAMTSFPGGFKAGFADSPVTEWREDNAYFAERYLGLPQNRVTEYNASSPLENVRRITGTVMVTAEAQQFGEVKSPRVQVAAKTERVRLMANLTRFFEATL